MSSGNPRRPDRPRRRAAEFDPPAGHSVFDDGVFEDSNFEDGVFEDEYEPAVDGRSFSVPAPEPQQGRRSARTTEPPQPDFVPPPRRRRKRRLLRWLVVALLVVAIVGIAEVLYLSRSFSSIERVETAGTLSATGGPGENFLIVGSDSRENLDPDAPDAGVIGDVGGERTDTVVLLRVEQGRNVMLPLPRDLWVPIAGTGGEQRINTAIQGGPERLIETVQTSLGVPVHHYIEIDFAGFKGLVDALGGIDVTFDHVTYDRKSGLDITSPGLQTLDGVEALAYVRSRAYTEVIDGSPRVDGTGDLGRIERQQIFLRAIFAKITSVRNPVNLNRIATAVTDDVRIDDALSFAEASDFARKLSAKSPETVALPVANATRGSASVLVMADGAQEALGQFR